MSVSGGGQGSARDRPSLALAAPFMPLIPGWIRTRFYYENRGAGVSLPGRGVSPLSSPPSPYFHA
jgi:hypothetical protein